MDWIEKQVVFPKSENEASYYFVSINDDGIPEVKTGELKTIKANRTGINQTTLVTVNGKVGFLKNSTVYDDSDDLELVIGFLGKKLGVRFADEYRVLNSDLEKVALLSMSIADGIADRFIDMEQVFERAVQKYKSKPFAFTDWMTGWKEVVEHEWLPDFPECYEFLCDTEEKCLSAIGITLKLVEFIGFNQEKSYRLFQKDYIKMILFDVLTGYVDRTMNNYGIIVSEDDFLFAPLFDSATLAKPYLPGNIYVLNNAAADRVTLLKVLTERYSEIAIPIIKDYLSVIDNIMTEIIKLAEDWIENENLELFLNNLKNNTELLRGVYAQYK